MRVTGCSAPMRGYAADLGQSTLGSLGKEASHRRQLHEDQGERSKNSVLRLVVYASTHGNTLLVPILASRQEVFSRAIT